MATWPPQVLGLLSAFASVHMYNMWHVVLQLMHQVLLFLLWYLLLLRTSCY